MGRGALALALLAAFAPGVSTGAPAFVLPDLGAAPREPLSAAHGMVASVSAIASGVGVDILKRGGNAVDAAVATGFALAVVWPAAGNLGGGGFMLVRLADGTAVAIDYRERAPAAARESTYLDARGEPVARASLEGPKAVGVPGTVAGFARALERYGTMSWAEVVEPARRLAAEGFAVPPALERSLAESRADLARDTLARRVLLRGDRPYAAGEILRQPELARTLERLRDGGPGEFYRGETARRIAACAPGWLTAADLADYRVVERAPLGGVYRGHEILTMPPPSSGGVLLLEMLHMLEGMDVRGMGAGSAREAHTLVEVMRRSFADRAEFLGDPDFVTVPTRGLTRPAYAARRAADIDSARASKSKDTGHGDPWPYESAETTHFAVVDARGNVVSNTYTLNDSYGNGVMVPGGGFLLNNEMDDFTTAPGRPNLYGLVQGAANTVRAGKRPLSTMTPTIVLRAGRPWFALGSPGGGRIVSAVLQVMLNVIDYGMNLQQAIDAPRIHHQWLPDSIRWEAADPAVRGALERMGHVFESAPATVGDVQGVMIGVDGTRLGASDPRLGGRPAGY